MKRSPFRLYLVTDRGMTGGRSLVEIVAAAARGGVSMVQLREKTATTRAFVEEARALKALLAPLGAPLLINDRIDVALACGADGAHVGQSDMPLDMARALLPAGAILGLSITSEADMRRADAGMADYLGVGPIHAQATKADATAPLGLSGFRAIRALSAKPMMVIGGIDAQNCAPLLEAGADGLAVVSAIMAAPDPRAAAAAFEKKLRAAGK